MTTLTKLRGALASFIDHSLLRWAVLSLAAAAVIATAAYIYREIDSELTAVTMLRREAVAQLMAATLTEKLERVADVAISLSTRVKLQELVAQGKWVEAIEFMRSVPQDLPYIERLILTDVKGTLKADVPALPGVRGVNLASRDWFRGVSRNWQLYVSPLYTRAAAPQLNVVAVAVPVKSTTGHIVGILVLQIRIGNLLERFAGINMGTDAFTYIVDSRGQVVFDSRHLDRKKIIDLSATPVVQKLRRGEQGVEIGFDAAEQEESIVAYAAVPGYGWGVVLQQPVRSSNGLAARDTQLRQLLIGYGIILLLGVMTAILLTLRIASERKRAEGDARLVTIVSTSTDAIISVDQDQRIVLFNYGAEVIFGYSAAEILGQPLDRLLPERFGATHHRHMQNFAAASETSRLMGERREIFGRRKDGAEFPAEASISKLTEKGRTIFTTILRDVTERKRIEEEIHRLNADMEHKVIERTAELAAANKELEAFSYSVSHDLRAPLRSIDGFSQALLEDYANQLDDQAKDYLNRVRSATQRMGHLIDDMLTLSNVTRAEMRRETVDLSALAADVLAELQKSEPERKMDWRIEPDLIAVGDERLLRVLLVNLLGNAWKFTGKTANAEIEFGSMRNAEGATEFFVRDNGAGFDMAYADKLFGAFQRLHLVSEFPGTGIGLATVQRIMHRHGGQVRGTGASGQGATFYFTLPG
jgi:PAS domain S-box-containing protein